MPDNFSKEYEAFAKFVSGPVKWFDFKVTFERGLALNQLLSTEDSEERKLELLNLMKEWYSNPRELESPSTMLVQFHQPALWCFLLRKEHGDLPLKEQIIPVEPNLPYCIKRVTATVTTTDGRSFTDSVCGELGAGPELMMELRQGRNPAAKIIRDLG